MAPDTTAFIVNDVLDSAEYADHRFIVTVVNAPGDRLDLHLTLDLGELLCERIAEAIERRYGRAS
ncbi:hypothetical protein NKI38_20200 [Mesorhizobium sp. M0621]|uniref:hypothetical protein n=1 Tax=Mesorhizobium sp. M0621 TaxID=2956974 RepID=UPI003339F8FF